MLEGQISNLNCQALHYFDQATTAVKAKDKMAFTNLARELMAEAREIFNHSRCQSILTHIEMSLQLKEDFNFKTYLDFCVRNNLPLLSQKDFDDLLLTLESDLIR